MPARFGVTFPCRLGAILCAHLCHLIMWGPNLMIQVTPSSQLIAVAQQDPTWVHDSRDRPISRCHMAKEDSTRESSSLISISIRRLTSSSSLTIRLSLGPLDQRPRFLLLLLRPPCDFCIVRSWPLTAPKLGHRFTMREGGGSGIPRPCHLLLDSATPGKGDLHQFKFSGLTHRIQSSMRWWLPPADRPS